MKYSNVFFLFTHIFKKTPGSIRTMEILGKILPLHTVRKMFNKEHYLTDIHKKDKSNIENTITYKN